MKKNKYAKIFFLGIVILLITFWTSNYYIQFGLIWGESMMPTYHNMQLVILDKHNQDYNIGDVVAFRWDGADTILIKRIVAGPGDKIQIREGKLYVNETLSVYYANADITYAGIIGEEMLLDKSSYFVMGDNQEESKDSRYVDIGCIEKQKIIGKIMFP